MIIYAMCCHGLFVMFLVFYEIIFCISIKNHNLYFTGSLQSACYFQKHDINHNLHITDSLQGACYSQNRI